MRPLIGFIIGLLLATINAGCWQENSRAGHLPALQPVSFEMPELPQPVAFETSRASIAPAAEDRSPAPEANPGAGQPTNPAPSDGPREEAGAGFSYVQCASGVCGPARRVAAAPVRFVASRQPVRRAWANRPRLFRGRR